jgi:hypothetical protein
MVDELKEPAMGDSAVVLLTVDDVAERLGVAQVVGLPDGSGGRSPLRSVRAVRSLR